MDTVRNTYSYKFEEKVTIDRKWALPVFKSAGKLYEFGDYHSQSCCEEVYADFTSLELNIKELMALGEIDELKIDQLDDGGALIYFCNNGVKVSEKYLINFYDIQNGMYSSNLELIMTCNGETVFKLDVEGWINKHERED